MQTREGKGWNTIRRLYAPLQPWFDHMISPEDRYRVAMARQEAGRGKSVECQVSS